MRKMAGSMNKNSAVGGSYYEKPSNYSQFHLRELKIIRSGRAIYSLDTIFSRLPSVTIINSRKLNEDYLVVLR